MGKMVAVPLILMLYNLFIIYVKHYIFVIKISREIVVDCQKNINDTMILHFYRTINVDYIVNNIINRYKYYGSIWERNMSIESSIARCVTFGIF